jgi:hypothetical protein
MSYNNSTIGVLPPFRTTPAAITECLAIPFAYPNAADSSLIPQPVCIPVQQQGVNVIDND